MQSYAINHMQVTCGGKPAPGFLKCLKDGFEPSVGAWYLTKRSLSPFTEKQSSRGVGGKPCLK